jgi:1-acyl-sn-glycerol-3-phosphate acyltransferase
MIVINYIKISVWILKFVCHIDYRIEGLENIPKNRNGIILSKHQSTWETFFIPTLFRDPAIITKRELLWLPFFGWGFATISPIAINRSNKTTAMEQIIKKGTQCLKKGRWILVFPEGTRIPPGKIGNYRLGGARLAIAAGGYPILPIAHNAGHFWKKNTFLKYPGTVHIVIGPIIETMNRKPEEVTEQAKNWIENTILKIEQAASIKTD